MEMPAEFRTICRYFVIDRHAIASSDDDIVRIATREFTLSQKDKVVRYIDRLLRAGVSDGELEQAWSKGGGGILFRNISDLKSHLVRIR